MPITRVDPTASVFLPNTLTAVIAAKASTDPTAELTSTNATRIRVRMEASVGTLSDLTSKFADIGQMDKNASSVDHVA